MNMQRGAHPAGWKPNTKIRKELGGMPMSPIRHYNAIGHRHECAGEGDAGPVAELAVLDKNSINLAFPAHKLTANLHYKLSVLGRSIFAWFYLGPRWGMVAPDLGAGAHSNISPPCRSSMWR